MLCHYIGHMGSEVHFLLFRQTPTEVKLRPITARSKTLRMDLIFAQLGIALRLLGLFSGYFNVCTI